jgi:hypothetical protein
MVEVNLRQLLSTEPPPPMISTPPPHPGGTLQMMPARTQAPPKSAMSGSTARMLIAAAIGSSLLATGWILFSLARARPAVAAVASAAPAAETTLPAEVDEPEIDFTVRASPANAVISIDGEAATTNPVVRRQRRDGAIHVIRVEAPGYEPREESVAFDRSFLVTVELKAAAVAPSAKTGGRRWKAAPRGGTGKPGASSGTLDKYNPYQ